MRLCFDLDGVICEIKSKDQTYSDVSPIIETINIMKKYKEAGHTIIIHTARHMKTCNNNPAMAVARIGKQTLDWLAIHDVPYDELLFGKPIADVYIDDNAFRYEKNLGLPLLATNLTNSPESKAFLQKERI